MQIIFHFCTLSSCGRIPGKQVRFLLKQGIQPSHIVLTSMHDIVDENCEGHRKEEGKENICGKEMCVFI